MEKDGSEQVTGLFTASVEKMRRLVAVARQLGGVAITTINTFDPDSLLPAEEQRRQLELDKSAQRLLTEAIKGGHASRFFSALQRRGIHTVRDLLIIGYNNLSFSELSTSRLIAAVNEAYPDKEFKAAPTPADIAKICLQLDQVTAAVLHYYMLDTKKLDELRDEYLHLPAHKIPRMTVADILDDTNPKSRRLLINFERARDEVMRFAVEFVAARERM
ncbi:MAG: hypothetical protein M3460_27190 [Actinomycetota bacterium]|nr:hypothetical protein [Actinomycetota bacterium]